MGYFRDIKPKALGFSSWNLHHFYTGFVVSLIAFIMIFSYIPMWVSLPIMILGFWLMIDDVVQHYVQKSQIDKFGVYWSVSFWNWLPNLIVKKLFHE